MIRYSKQIILSDIGLKGQIKLRKASVLCVGVGGLGSSVLIYLSSMGVGTLGIVDMDVVELSNLHRQIMFTTNDLGKSKVKVAKSHIKKLNPTVMVKSYNFELLESNIGILIKNYDLVVDCTDNLKTKFLINKYAMRFNMPLVYGAIFGFEGYVSVFLRKSACYFCLYKNMPIAYVPTCSESGVLGVVAGIIGNIQALEVIKLILSNFDYSGGIFSGLVSKLLVFNAKFFDFKILKLNKYSKCEVCNNIFLNTDCNLISKKNYKRTKNFDFSIKSLNFKSYKDIKLIDIRKNKRIYIEYMKYFDTIEVPFSDLINLNSVKTIILKCYKYIILCEYGLRSKFICNFLRKNGYNNVFYLK